MTCRRTTTGCFSGNPSYDEAFAAREAVEDR